MVRIIVLKARRLGMSTYVQGRYFAKAATRTNRNVQIVTHSRSATNSMFNMARRFEENLPAEIKPAVKYSGKNELVWSELGSSYSLATVGGKEVGVVRWTSSIAQRWHSGVGGNEYLLGGLNTVVQVTRRTLECKWSGRHFHESGRMLRKIRPRVGCGIYSIFVFSSTDFL